MHSKRVWKSAVARILTRQQKSQPVPDSVAALLLAQAQKGLSASHYVEALAQRLRDSDQQLDKKCLEQVDLTVVCNKVGLAVDYQPLSVDALLQETESGYLTLINSTASQSRQRLSLAHEIGHLMLYQATGLRQAFGHVSPNERRSSESLEIEELCDCFASELIMPSDVWRRVILRDGMSLSTFKKLKAAYGVSTTSAAQRMVEVGSIECAIIIWKPIYRDKMLIKLDPIYCWEKITSGKNCRPPSIEPIEEFLGAGSPYYALEKSSATAGKVSIPLNGIKAKYLAHSDVISATHIMTLLIPERFGWGIMFRDSKSEQASAFK
jgi:Zn-dependent peptidase ImmA (M78 family)